MDHPPHGQPHRIRPSAANNGFAAWNGTSWRASDPQTDGGILASDQGQLMVRGLFKHAADEPSSLLARIATCPSPCPADVNGDGLTDFADYLVFLDSYDAGC